MALMLRNGGQCNPSGLRPSGYIDPHFSAYRAIFSDMTSPELGYCSSAHQFLIILFINWYALSNAHQFMNDTIKNWCALTNAHQFMDFIRYAPVNTWYVKHYRLLIYLITMLNTIRFFNLVTNGWQVIGKYESTYIHRPVILTTIISKTLSFVGQKDSCFCKGCTFVGHT